MDDQKRNPLKQLSTAQWLTVALVAAFVIAAAITARLTYVAVRDFVATWRITNLPGIALTEPQKTPDASNPSNPSPQDITVPLQPSSGPTPEPWDGASRVTLLVMGLDYGDWSSPDRQGPPRTDTMILFTIDPLARTAGILSIPRDLWVNIPGYQYGRINTAYMLGEADKLEGGGPGLAMKTVEKLMGVPIDYYAQIDFNAFVKFIDIIGGVKINVPDRIVIDELGDNNMKVLKPGVQTLDGALALAYARARHTEGGDFDRAQRQQQVILGIRQQILRPDVLPMIFTKAPVLYAELSSGVHTNLSLEQALKLGWLASQIPLENIKRGVISPPEQVLLTKAPDGSDVLKPIADKIRNLRDEIFAQTGPTSPVATSMPLQDLAKAENARLSVLNGSSTTGLAARTTEYLQSLGLNVTNTGNADGLVNNTTIFDYTGNPYTVKYLVETMKITPTRVFSRYDPTSPVDVVVVAGLDWAANNTMP
jgi:LCP family protein required for cell wall assembly